MGKRTIERRKRGFFGWIFAAMFWGWNVLMVIWLFAALSENSSQYEQLTSEAERQGYAAGTGLAFMFVLIIWAMGAVVFGLLSYFTRGRREWIEVDGS